MPNLTFSNPVREADLDWPAAEHRTIAKFRLEFASDGLQRVSRETTGKPKFSPWSQFCRLVEGSDGKHYIGSWLTPSLIGLTQASMGKTLWFSPGSPIFEQLNKLFSSKHYHVCWKTKDRAGIASVIHQPLTFVEALTFKSEMNPRCGIHYELREA